MITATIKPKRAANPRDNPRLIVRYLVITPDMQTPIDLYVYRASTIGNTQRFAVYADVYIRHGTLQASGTGKAGSAPVPYDQARAAINAALNNAGIMFYADHLRLFEVPIPDAIRALCAALGLTEWRIIQ